MQGKNLICVPFLQQKSLFPLISCFRPLVGFMHDLILRRHILHPAEPFSTTGRPTYPAFILDKKATIS